MATSAVRPGSSTLANITFRPLTRGTASENVCGGGWALATYFNVPSRPDRSYHGFMQPDGGRYWGNRDFWKMA